MIYLLLWLVCGSIAAAIAQKKGEGVLGFVVGLIFGPIGIIAAIFSKGKLKECPYCKERINKKAIRCPHCQKDL